MSKLEYVDLSGLRIDGRRPNELRNVSAKLGVLTQPDGSAVFEIGITKVLCAVYGPRECTLRSKELHDRALVNVEVSQQPFASGEHKKRSRGDRQIGELSSMLRESAEALLLTAVHPRSQIDIIVDILQSDGGLKAACLNAATLALIDAGLPMKDFMVACTAGCIDGHVVVDTNYMEDSARGPELLLALLPNQDRVVTCQLEPKLPAEQLGPVMDCATQGCRQIYKSLHAAVLEHSMCLAASRGAAPA
uniref:Uncharacterized protein n=1 Tax=Hemiselmis tepida TaxID=464990 RepID=A0A7S0VHA9_9CRYP|mmetsp:Transcript_17278/g.43532  ORF Transcript_17278/g.43532 Transcript_17278/m.43532 type:complete len:248 (+) Transcript_17278:20-763(+)